MSISRAWIDEQIKEATQLHNDAVSNKNAPRSVAYYTGQLHAFLKVKEELTGEKA